MARRDTANGRMRHQDGSDARCDRGGSSSPGRGAFARQVARRAARLGALLALLVLLVPAGTGAKPEGPTVSESSSGRYSLEVLGPGAGALTNDPTPIVRLKAEALCDGDPCASRGGAAGAGLRDLRVRATLNGVPVGDAFDLSRGIATYVPEKGLPEGNNVLVAEVVDQAGASAGEVTSSFTVDTTAPVFGGVKPDTGAVVGTPRATITGETDDPQAEVQLAVPADPARTFSRQSPGEFGFEVPLREGDNAFRLEASDAAGNQAVEEVRVTRRTPVVLAVESPEGAVEQSPVAVRGRVDGPRGTAVRVGEVEAEVNGGAFAAEGVTLREGQNDLVVAATTPDGRTEERRVEVVYEPRQAATPPANAPVDGPVDGPGAGKPAATGASPGAPDEPGDTPGREEPEVRTERAPDQPGVTAPGPLPEDPEGAAPPVERGVATSVADSTEFLYEGEDAVQTGVEAGAIDGERAAIARGEVKGPDGDPLPGARVTVLDHDEYGTTLTREDGSYDLAVEGGGSLTLVFEKEGYLPSHRLIDAPLRDFVGVDEVAMVPFSERVTEVDLEDSGGTQVAQGVAVSDGEGTRRATTLFSAGTEAEMVLPGGNRRGLSSLDLRATEYTVGEDGPESMPAPLPPTSGYTYAVELSVDQAVEAGAQTVEFSEPVYNYVENFLDFPVGTDVPSGYYDREQGAWIPSEDGRIVEVLAEKDGLAVLDVAGDGEVAGDATLEKLDFTDAERRELAELYGPGDSLWRVPVDHFSVWDWNFGFGPPEDARAPGQPSPPPEGNIDPPEEADDDPPTEDDGDPPKDWELPEPKEDAPVETKDEDCAAGSIIECQNQILGEDLRVTGSPTGLHYGGDRVPGRTAANTIEIPLSPKVLPPGLKRIVVEVDVAGQSYTQAFPAEPNQTYNHVWNGKDAYGRPVQGKQTAEVGVGYVYDGEYQRPPDGKATFAEASGVPMTADANSREVTLWRRTEHKIGTFDAKGLGLGGWTLDVLHHYDPAGRSLQLGNGDRREADDFDNTIESVAGIGEGHYGGDGGQATRAPLNPQNADVAPDGSVYIADVSNHRVRKISPDGTITTVAGSGSQGDAGYAGDGGAATQAKLNAPRSVAVDPDGGFYVADSGNSRVRRVGPGGNITTYAGTGTAGYGGDGGPARQARLNNPTDVDLAPDGSLYVADSNNSRVRKVGPGGNITTVAGDGQPAFGGDGGPAQQASLCYPKGLDVRTDGTVFIADTFNQRIRRVGPGGSIATVAGNGDRCAAGGLGQGAYAGDGGPATQARLNRPQDVAVSDTGPYYVADWDNQRVRRVAGGTITTVAGDGTRGAWDAGKRVPTDTPLEDPKGVILAPDGDLYLSVQYRLLRLTPAMPGVGADEMTIPSESGDELYVFDDEGQHLRTQDAITGAVLWRFSYDTEGRISSVEDVDGLLTAVERDASGNATAIVTPSGERTELAVGPGGYLEGVTNPAGEAHRMTYGNGGLLASLADPKGNTSRFFYGIAGRLIRDEDPAGGHKALARSATARGFKVDLATAMRRTSTFEVQDLPDGSRRHVSTDPSGLKEFRLVDETGTVRKALAPDGTRTEATEAPDPRFGTQSPYVESAKVTTPGGLSASVSAGREATLANPTDPLSAISLTEKLTVNGRTTTSTWEKATGKVATVSPEGRRSSATLDAKGRVVLDEATGFAPTRYAYDGRGRPTEATTTDGINPRTATYAYDEKDRLTGVTDAVGRTTAYAYDAAGRVTRQTLPDGRAVGYSYDKNGNLASLTPPQRSPHAFGHTARNQASSYTPPAVNGETAEARATTWQYNPDRQPTSVTKPGGEAVSFSYDSGGRLAAVAHPGGETTYSYDPETGNLAGATEAGGQRLAFSYDGFLPTKEALTGGVSGEVAQSYDRDFRPVEQTVNGGNPVAYSYDGDGLLTKAGSETVTREADTGLVTATALGRTSDSRAFNAFGEPKSYSARHDASALYETSYQRDSLGRITSKTETIGTTTSTHAYSYDKAGRLTEVKKDGATVASYAYDANGNRLSRADASGNKTNATIGAQDRLLAYGQNQYRYSADGDLASKISPQGTTSYSYDALGGLKTVALPGSKRVEYLVDAAGRRVGKKVDGSLKQGFLWSGSSPVAELGASGNVVSRFVYATKSNVPDYMVRGGKTYRIVSDHLGSPRLVVDAETGEVAQRMDYDEFGVVTRDTNPGFQPFGFAGGLYDADTGLVRFGARDYDPETGRWTAKDPILFGGGDANLYGYVQNDPVNFVDPSGLFLDTILDVGFIGYDVYRIAKDNVFGDCGNLGTNLTALGADIGGAAVPFATGGGVAVRGGLKVVDEANPGRIFVTNSGGTTVPAPAGYPSRSADNGKGILFQRPGATGNADTMRVMEPTERYPSGYARYYNSYGQPVDVRGKPSGQADTHLPLDEPGIPPGWPR